MLDKYIDTLFEDAPKDEETVGLREEMRQRSYSDYEKCIDGGMTENAAYASAVKSVSDLRIVVDEIKSGELAVKDKGFFNDDTANDSQPAGKGLFSGMSEKEQKTLRSAFISVAWIIVTIIYLAVSFISGWWHLTWLIFLMASVLTMCFETAGDVVKLRKCYEKKQYKKLYNRVSGNISGIMWLSVVITYFIVSFMTGWWHITWILYLVGAAAQIILSTALKLGKRKF